MVVAVPAADCAELIPDSWAQGVSGAALPTQAELVPSRLPALADDEIEQLRADLETERRRSTAWRTFGVRESGQREKANERTVDTIDIVNKCENRARLAMEKLTERSLWQRLTPWAE